MAADVVKIEKEPDPTDLDLKAWYSAMGGGGADIEVVVSRVQPPHWKLPNGRVVPIAGKIPGALYTEMIDEEFIEQTFGGGLYKLGIKKRHADGRMQFWKQKTVKVGGDPIVDPSMLASNAYQPDDGHAAAAVAAAARPEPSGESPTLSMHALDTMKEVVDDLRSDRGRGNGGGIDHALLEILMAPMRAQLEQNQKTLAELQKALSDKDSRIMELLSRRPDTSTQDTLIGKMWDSESGRIEAIRTQHDSERNALRASHEAREASLVKQHERDLHNKEEDQKRLLDTLQRAHDGVVKNMEAMHALEVKMLENRVQDLGRDLGEARSKVGSLETIKQQSFADKVKEIKEFKDLVSDGDDDRDEKPSGLWGTIQTVAEGLIENPEVIGQMLGARGGPPPGPPPQQEQRVARLPDGRVVRVMPRPAPAAPPAAAALPSTPSVPAQPISEGAAVAAAPAPPVRPPSQVELMAAVAFLENACKSGQDPVVVAASSRSLVQADVLAYLEKVGVDELLNGVTTLDQGSPLRTVQGRNFVRKVAKTLLTGAPE